MISLDILLFSLIWCLNLVCTPSASLLKASTICLSSVCEQLNQELQFISVIFHQDLSFLFSSLFTLIKLRHSVIIVYISAKWENFQLHWMPLELNLLSKNLYLVVSICVCGLNLNEFTPFLKYSINSSVNKILILSMCWRLEEVTDM